MLAIDVELTLILLLALPIMGSVTYFFRQATRQLFRLVRLSVSSLNQYMQENLAGLQVVQLSDRQEENLARYTEINEENRAGRSGAPGWKPSTAPSPTPWRTSPWA